MTDPKSIEEPAKRRFLTKRLVKRLLAFFIFVAVSMGIVRTIRNASSRFQHQQRELAAEIQTQTIDLKQLRDDDASAEQIHRAEDDLDDLLGQRFHWSSIRFPWLLVACCLYAVGMMPSWWS